jgi:predicted acyl esterase
MTDDRHRTPQLLGAALAFFLGLALLLAFTPVGAQELSEYVTMTDGTLLATDVYLPIGAGPWPVVVTRTPYDIRDPGHYDTWCRTLSRHGYACVAQDLRGCGRSGGTYTAFRADRTDGYDTILWVSRQSWCNGAIASAGGSAMGITGYAMAASSPPGLRCLVAALATPDLFHQLFLQNGALRWELMYYGMSDTPQLRDDFLAHRLWSEEQWGDYDYLPADRSIDVKALHFGGWWDLFSQGTLDAFHHYQTQGSARAATGQHLIMGPWYHFSLATSWMAQTIAEDRQTGELRYPDNAFPGAWPFAGDTWQLLLDWLGFCLRDETTEVSDWSPVQVYLMGPIGEGGSGNHWISFATWPPSSTVTPYHLDGDRRLSRTMPGPDELRLLIDPDDPVPTLGGPNRHAELDVAGWPMGAGPFDQRRVEARADVLGFTSDVLQRSLTVVGSIRCRIWLRPDTPDLDLSVRLTDVYPDGRSMLVTDGIQRARMRCGHDRECLLIPGVPVEIEVDLWSTAYVFNPGHRIRVDVAGSSWPRFDVNPNHGGDPGTGPGIVANPDILVGPDYPSALLLPVLPSPRRPGGRVLGID